MSFIRVVVRPSSRTLTHYSQLPCEFRYTVYFKFALFQTSWALLFHFPSEIRISTGEPSLLEGSFALNRLIVLPEFLACSTKHCTPSKSRTHKVLSFSGSDPEIRSYFFSVCHQYVGTPRIQKFRILVPWERRLIVYWSPSACLLWALVLFANIAEVYCQKSLVGEQTSHFEQ